MQAHGATALRATKLMQKSTKRLILSTIFRMYLCWDKLINPGLLAATAPQSKDILRNNSVLLYCLTETGRATERTCTSLVQLTSTLFQVAGGVPKIQAMLRCLQRRIHPTMSYPKAPFVSQPSNASGRYQSQCKVNNVNWSYWTMQTGPTGSY